MASCPRGWEFSQDGQQRRDIMTQKLKSPQSLSIMLGGGMVVIAVAGVLFSLVTAGAALPVAGQLAAGAVGMLAGAKVA
jgi:hypothetical protein